MHRFVSVVPWSVLAVIAVGCGKGGAPTAAPSVASGCEGRHITVATRSNAEDAEVVELRCDAGTPTVRFTAEKLTANQPVERTLSSAEWDATWKAIDASGWQTMPEDCSAPDEAVRGTTEYRVQIGDRSFVCNDLATTDKQLTMITAVGALARPWRDAAARTAEAQPSPFEVQRGRVGGIRIGASLDEVRQLPDVHLKDATVMTEGGDRPIVEVWIGQQRQLELFVERGTIAELHVVGTLPRLRGTGTTTETRGAGVGTSAAELERRFGKPIRFARSRWHALGCAEFAQQPEVRFCFDGDDTEWAEPIEERAVVYSMFVQP
jgi:hypothetical protein